jgi:TatD DNase family protein
MRDAQDDTLKIIKQYKMPELKGVMHCYSGSAQMMNAYLSLNMYISLAGPVTFKNARIPKEVAKQIPLESLLIETDSPYLAPHPFRGKPNEPKYLPYIAREIANIKELSVSEVARRTSLNARTLFRL